MKLNLIEERGLWKDFANYINYNYNKLNIAINRINDIGSAKLSTFKGVFKNISDLTSCYPNPEYGDYSFVLSSGTIFKIYVSDIGGNWIELSGIYNPEVDLSEYIEISALSNISDISGDIEDYLNSGN